MMVPYNGSGSLVGKDLAMAPGGEESMAAGAAGGVSPTHLIMAAADMRASGRLSQIMTQANARPKQNRR